MQVRAAFGHQLQSQRWTEPVDLRQVSAQHPVKRGPHIEGRCIVLLALDPCLGQWGQILVGLDRQRPYRSLQPAVARLDLCLVEVVKLQRLRQSKDVFIAVVADQRGFDCFHR